MTKLVNFEKALAIGRPPNIIRLFPNSQALIVSGKAIDRGLLKKNRAMTIAANARNHLIIHGVLLAAQEANAAIIIEIAKSEGGCSAYCAINFWNIACHVDALMNELKITIPVAIHADHYEIKNEIDIKKAQVEIPSIFDAGITSIAIDASHMSDADNLLANIHLNPIIPSWAGLETEIGEIRGAEGLSTVEEALFLIKGLNAYDIFPDWIALNNGTSHGIQTSEHGIHVELTKQIHNALALYNVSGAQHGTSGNDTARLKRIAAETRTTKANLATALQMISWGIKVDNYGNAEINEKGNFVKLAGRGMTDELWNEMTMYAKANNLKLSDYKKLNLLFENKILSQPKTIRYRMITDVQNFTYHLLTKVFNAQDSAPLSIASVLEANSYDLGAKTYRIEDPQDWIKEKIKNQIIHKDKEYIGNFED